jgi:glucose-6-phosphate 1-dehydrogenase
MQPTKADALVFFGATGDLAFKKIFPALQSMEQIQFLDMPIIAVTRGGRCKEDLLDRVRKSLETHGGGIDETAFGRLADRLQIVSGEYDNTTTFHQLEDALDGKSHPVFYLAIPPSAYAGIITELGRSGCARGGRLLIEKPFGYDVASSSELNSAIHQVFDETNVFRLDHYAGKLPVQNILLFRFANAFPEAFWNRNYVSSVKITMAESFGIKARGQFYEEAGAIRDVLQNHLFLVVALLAMEPPSGSEDEALRDEMVKVYKCMRPLSSDNVVRGQFKGYRLEEGVSPESEIETYVAVRLYLDSWRWDGVPFFIRTGKCLAVTANEVLVELRRPPRNLLTGADFGQPNRLRFGLGPDLSIAMSANIRKPGLSWELEDAEMVACREASQEDEVAAYRDLLRSAMQGDAVPFARADGVEAQWRVVAPVLGNVTPVYEYEPGTWGPGEAERLVQDFGDWIAPTF